MDESNNVLGLSGLINISNTCYLNSILQTLFNNNHLKEYLLNEDIIINNKYEKNLLNELKKIIQSVYSENSVILPKSFIQTLSIINKENLNEQNDPDEYYEKIITRLYEETCIEINNNNITNINESDKSWLKYFNKKFSYINNLYYGQYKSEMLCEICNNISITYEPFISIKLELKHNNLLNCLKQHLSWEEDIEYKCEKCNKINKSKKRLTLMKLPKILIFTFKSYNNLIEKNMINITYPILFEIDNNKYELNSVINHYGFCLEGGHYTAFCKNIINNNWYEFDDRNIILKNLNNINSSDIYMLIYHQI